MENNGNSLAKISLGVSVALLIAVIILFVKMPSGADTTEVVDTDDSLQINVPVNTGGLRIGYFVSDSLTNNLLMTKEIEGLIEQASIEAQNKLSNEERAYTNWEKKWTSGGQILPSEQQEFARQAQEKQQRLMRIQQEVQFEMSQKQEGYMIKMVSTISDAAKEYAQANGFDYILSYQFGQNVYYCAPQYDITQELIRILNTQYEERSAVGVEGVDESAE